jgi:hypothetical protein
MTSFLNAQIDQQRRERYLSEAESFRQARAARPVRPARVSRKNRIVTRPLYAFQTWVAAGQL